MMSDPHLKRAKNIRMADDLRQRFEKLQETAGMPADQFIALLLDSYESRSGMSDSELISRLEMRLRKRSPEKTPTKTMGGKNADRSN